MGPLPGTQPGDAVRGAAIVASRQGGLCLLCHSAPLGDTRLHGNLGPSLNGAGARWTAGQLRQRVADASSLNPDTVMPSYLRRSSGSRIPAALADRPLLDAQQIEDIVAYLLTLRDPGP
ncbi:MAG: sulfur oxidation c-type cytochrome SoxX [Rhodoferax sp.]|nr:sulfur oxidation c-type cytochrome SoxX [Rhodoferax sp.]